jgi:hypothetical protein
MLIFSTGKALCQLYFWDILGYFLFFVLFFKRVDVHLPFKMALDRKTASKLLSLKYRHLVRWKELADEKTGSPWYHLKLSPGALDFEKGIAKAPTEGVAPNPGRDG